MEINELILELDPTLIVTKKEVSNRTIYIHCEVKRQTTSCPYCDAENSSIHSKYIRTISDLPIQNYQVKLVITINKYFCQNKRCKHKTYAPSLPFIAKNSVRTKRLNEYICKVALKHSSMETKKQISNNHVEISHNTILRILKKTILEINYNVKNIGIDDFSQTKRKIYYTLIVDNDTRKNRCGEFQKKE